MKNAIAVIYSVLILVLGIVFRHSTIGYDIIYSVVGLFAIGGFLMSPTFTNVMTSAPVYRQDWFTLTLVCAIVIYVILTVIQVIMGYWIYAIVMTVLAFIFGKTLFPIVSAIYSLIPTLLCGVD